MTSNSQLETLLQEAYQNLHQALVTQHTAQIVALRDEFLKIRAEAPAEKPIRSTWEAWPSKGNMGRFEYRSNAAKRNLLDSVLIRDPSERYVSHCTYLVPEDFDTRVQAKAEKFATEALASYVAKLTGKLHEIWGLKEIAEMKFSGSLDYHFLNFTFTDGACFTIQNNVVHHVNSYGTWYAQFPSTFHNVCLADGTSMRNPSEAKMKKLFAAHKEIAQ